MGKMLNIVTPTHSATRRDCYARMDADKPRRMRIAKQYGKEYWDGDGSYGYNNYRYIEGRQTPIAQALIDEYDLTSTSSVLDIGCGRGFLLYEFTHLLPGIMIAGIDASHYALETAHPPVKDKLRYGRAEHPLPYGDYHFDLIVSINTLHNLHEWEIPLTLKEITRVGYNSYICLESWHDEETQSRLQSWALTCNTFKEIPAWIKFYTDNGSDTDYEFIEF